MAARTLYEKSLSIRRELNNRAGMAMSLSDLARVACAEGRYAEREPCWRRACGSAGRSERSACSSPPLWASPG